MRQVVLDTETTGLEVAGGHRVIEIGGVELINRRRTARTLHYYLNPQREVDAGAQAVHGLSNDFLADKPLFAQVAQDVAEFLAGAELIIHNAAFDLGFLDAEFERAGLPVRVADHCTVLDTLALARHLHPGQRNTLDALCRRYAVDASARELHGARLDAELLAEVYLAMTGGQATLELAGAATRAAVTVPVLDANRPPLPVRLPTAQECAAHALFMAHVAKASGGRVAWPMPPADAPPA